MSKKLTLIGFGNMGRALIDGWLNRGVVNAADITVVDPAETGQQAAKERNLAVYASAKELGGHPDILVLAIKPQVAALALENLPIRPDLVLSIMAGIRCREIVSWTGVDAVARVMPNTPAQVGCGYSGYFLTEAATQAVDLVEELLEAVGTAQRVFREEDLDKITAITGSGPGYMMQLAEEIANQSVRLGFSKETGVAMAAALLEGSGKWLRESGEHPVVLRDMVTSPGGTTAAGLQALNRHNPGAMFGEAFDAALQRSRELGDS